jgi:hypothetical protein
MKIMMKMNKLPQTDSIQELARFWEKHDLADFEDELEEVTEPVFKRSDSIRLNLKSRHAEAVRRIADSKGVSQAELIGQWVLQKLGRRKRNGQAKV